MRNLAVRLDSRNTYIGSALTPWGCVGCGQDDIGSAEERCHSEQDANAVRAQGLDCTRGHRAV